MNEDEKKVSNKAEKDELDYKDSLIPGDIKRVIDKEIKKQPKNN